MKKQCEKCQCISPINFELCYWAMYLSGYLLTSSEYNHKGTKILTVNIDVVSNSQYSSLTSIWPLCIYIQLNKRGLYLNTEETVTLTFSLHILYWQKQLSNESSETAWELNSECNFRGQYLPRFLSNGKLLFWLSNLNRSDTGGWLSFTFRKKEFFLALKDQTVWFSQKRQSFCNY